MSNTYAYSITPPPRLIPPKYHHLIPKHYIRTPPGRLDLSTFSQPFDESIQVHARPLPSVVQSRHPSELPGLIRKYARQMISSSNPEINANTKTKTKSNPTENSVKSEITKSGTTTFEKYNNNNNPQYNNNNNPQYNNNNNPQYNNNNNNNPHSVPTIMHPSAVRSSYPPSYPPDRPPLPPYPPRYAPHGQFTPPNVVYFPPTYTRPVPDCPHQEPAYLPKEHVQWQARWKHAPSMSICDPSAGIGGCEVSPRSDRLWVADLNPLIREYRMISGAKWNPYRHWASRQMFNQFIGTEFSDVNDPYTKKINHLSDSYCIRRHLYGQPQYTTF